MGKMVTAIGIMSGVVLLFYFGGVLTDTASSAFLDLLLNPDNLQNTPLATKIVALLASILGVASLILRFGSNSDLFLLVPIVELFLSFGWDFLRVYQSFAAFGGAAQVVAVLLFSPFMIMYLIAVIEWWRGVET